ncbi:DNA oxidative demethylase ALKBH2 isoform X2 [Ambystoma mexicanum]|uniref:DNA oxidative demethylase ALKBH2 isoform X2 n=1 Tax=Ambystoma mexicanum TaxID=8296 RepID=UPI0037E923EE
MDTFVIKAAGSCTSGKRKRENLETKTEEGLMDTQLTCDDASRGLLSNEKATWPPYTWTKIKSQGLDCDYTSLFCKAEADDIFLELENKLTYFSDELSKVKVFGKWHNIARKQVSYGDPGLTYTYSGVTLTPKPWIPVLECIRDRVKEATGYNFNFVLINRYKDGNDHIGEHRDDEKELVPRSPIASVSLGACRDFFFRHGASRGKIPSSRIEPVKLQLAHGSLLMMNYPTNVHWYHSLPARKKILAPRINLTFRKIILVK